MFRVYLFMNDSVILNDVLTAYCSTRNDKIPISWVYKKLFKKKKVGIVRIYEW